MTAAPHQCQDLQGIKAKAAKLPLTKLTHFQALEFLVETGWLGSESKEEWEAF